MLLFCEYVTFDIEPPVDISSAFAACACNGVSIKREIIVQKQVRLTEFSSLFTPLEVYLLYLLSIIPLFCHIKLDNKITRFFNILFKIIYRLFGVVRFTI